MALQYIDEVLGVLDQRKSEMIHDLSVKIQDKSEIEIKAISTETEWRTAQSLSANAFGTIMDPIFFQSRTVSARRFLSEAYMAVYRGEMIGIIMAADWGTFRLIGPIACSTKYLRNGIATKMMEYLLNHSPKILNNDTIKREILSTFCGTFHVPMYMKYGFDPLCIAYASSVDVTAITNDDLPKRYLTHHYKYTFSPCHNCDADKSFVAQAKRLCTQIYNGWDLTELIEGNWKLKDIGNSYGLYDGSNQLLGFAVCNYGANAEIYDASHLKINCLVALNEEIFGILVVNVIKEAQKLKCTRVTAELKVARIKAFRILIDAFHFEYDPTKVRITMGKCRGTDVVYNDHCTYDSFVIDTW